MCNFVRAKIRRGKVFALLGISPAVACFFFFFFFSFHFCHFHVCIISFRGSDHFLVHFSLFSAKNKIAHMCVSWEQWGASTHRTRNKKIVSKSNAHEYCVYCSTFDEDVRRHRGCERPLLLPLLLQYFLAKCWTIFKLFLMYFRCCCCWCRSRISSLTRAIFVHLHNDLGY